MSKLGSFAFVLHTHLPYSRNAGRWPHGEEWLFEAACETYIPLVEMLRSLPEGLPAGLTMSLTPVLLEQLASPEVIAGTLDYIDDRTRRAGRDASRFESLGDPEGAALARFYQDWYDGRGRFLRDVAQGDLVGALRDLESRGLIESISSGATHGYLPLLSRDSSIYAQVRAGVETHRRHMRTSPDGFWLPECAYRGADASADPRRPGLEEFLEAAGVSFFFVESHAVEGGSPAIDRRSLPEFYLVHGQGAPGAPAPVSPTGHTTARPYYVADSNVVAIARNRRLSMQVWSADLGYPGDATYREFHKKDSVSGMQYWAISGPGIDLGDKRRYQPGAARERVESHARHFAGEVVAELSRQSEVYGERAFVTAVFDTELFGHWWFEGVDWLAAVLRLLGEDERVDVIPVREALRRHPPESAIELPTSSWGTGGDDRTWNNGLTQEMWQTLHQCEVMAERVAARVPMSRRPFVLQALRELLLAQSSDWPFLMTTGQAASYGRRRFETHVERFRLLARLAQAEAIQAAEWEYLRDVQSRDELFAALDPEWFCERQGSAR